MSTVQSCTFLSTFLKFLCLRISLQHCLSKWAPIVTWECTTNTLYSTRWDQSSLIKIPLIQFRSQPEWILNFQIFFCVCVSVIHFFSHYTYPKLSIKMCIPDRYCRGAWFVQKSVTNIFWRLCILFKGFKPLLPSCAFKSVMIVNIDLHF